MNNKKHLETATTIPSSMTDRNTSPESAHSSPVNLDPADVLIERAKGWKEFVSALKHKFERKAEFEKAELKILVADQKSDATAKVSQHTALLEGLLNQTVPALDGLNQSLKKKVLALETDQKERRTERIQDMDLVSKAKQALSKALHASESNKDPWLLNLELRVKLSLATTRHETRNESLKAAKTDFKLFEANLIRQLKIVLMGVMSFTEIMPTRTDLSAEIEKALESLDTEREWQLFCDARLDKTEGPAMFETEHEEWSHEAMVQVVYEGVFGRKGIFNSFREHYYVLTVGGFLHEFKMKPSVEHGEWMDPEDTIQLADCSLGPLGIDCQFSLAEKRKGAMFQKSYRFLGSSLSESEVFHAAVASVANIAMELRSTETVVRIAGQDSPLSSPLPPLDSPRRGSVISYYANVAGDTAADPIIASSSAAWSNSK
ncbi:hypothetical protein HDU98_003662 [Podochytrium sp. JEL0797]|nr:hypothetical protein HDU98_003662 [Podochytrium sp. JEL0797]